MTEYLGQVIKHRFGFHSGRVKCAGIVSTNVDDQDINSSLSYSGGRAPAGMRVSLTTARTNQFCGGQIWVTASGEPLTDSSAKAFVAFRASIDATNAMTFENSAKQGSIYGGIFIAKASSATGNFGVYHPLIGIEGWAYPAHADIKVKTMIGGNFGYHTDSTANQGSGSVWRGVQIFCDNASATVTEETGLCLWNQAGTQTNAIKIVQSGSGFTNLLSFASVAAPIATQSGGGITHTHKIAVDVAGATRYIGVGTF
jgi:hypothetical protein